MSSRRRRSLAAATLAMVLLAGCAPRPDTGPAADAPSGGEALPPAWVTEPGTPYALDPARSAISVRVYRAGRLAHLGHNHLVEVRGLRGALRRLNGGGGLAQLGFRVDEMRVDDPAARALAGSDFAQTPDAAAVTGTRANMLGEKVLNAARWPEIQVSARIADLAAAQPLADIQVSLHGVGRRYQTPVRIQASPGRLSVTGSLFLRQSDFGMAPFSVLGGALQVRDAIEVDFRVVGRNSDDPM